MAFGRVWWSVILLCVFLGGVSGYGVAKRTDPVYEASIILAVGDEMSPSNVSVHDVQASDSLAQMYGALVRSQPVLANVTHQLGLGMSWRLLKDHVHVAVGQNAPLVPLVDITVLASSLSRATMIANAIATRAVALGPGAGKSRTVEKARAFVASQSLALRNAIARGEREVSRLSPGIRPWERKQLRSTMQLITDWQRNYLSFAHFASSGGSANNLRILGNATGSRARIRPHTTTDTALGAGVGALVALCLVQAAFLRKRRQTKQRSESMSRYAGLRAPSDTNVASPDPWISELAGLPALRELSIRDAVS